MPEKKNIVLITMDCVRAGHTGFMGYHKDITPNLDALARESFLFRRAYPAGSPTYNAFPALLAGRTSTAFGRDLTGISPGETTLASHLRSLGYVTGAVTAANPYVSKWMGYDTGFDFFEDFMDTRGDDKPGQLKNKVQGAEVSLRTRINLAIAGVAGNVPLLRHLYNELYFRYSLWKMGKRAGWDYRGLLEIFPRAAAVTGAGLDFIKEIRGGEEARGMEEGKGGPFFLWLHYMDAHRPYCPPEESLKAMGRPDITHRKMFELRNLWLRNSMSNRRLMRHRQDFMDLYDASIHGLDAGLGRVFRHLDTLDILKDTLIIVTSDHGETFLEHGERDHDPVSVHEELIHVPLLVHAPWLGQAREVQSPFGHLDLLATALDMAGAGSLDSFKGKSRAQDIAKGREWDAPALTEMPFGYDTRPRDRVVEPTLRLAAVTGQRYKLEVNFRTRTEALFDLQQDPGERQGMLLSDNPAESARLLRALGEHLERQLKGRHSKAEFMLRLQNVRESLGLDE